MEKIPQETLSDIHRIMERSSRFRSLNGFSFVAAGICGLLGAWWTSRSIAHRKLPLSAGETVSPNEIRVLVWIAGFTLSAAVISGLLFTLIKVKKRNLPLLDMTFRRVSASFAIPMLAGGIFIAGVLFYHQYQFIASACLLFYGIALINASHYTVKEIYFLGIAEIITAIICLFAGYEILLLALGFGIMNMLFGLIIWNKYK
ncbi:MAG: hypothetical protein EPN37_05295 [Chitinophagaceae bacterium]|nr:MAG: hypothetical protein EPN37_05295 [Chitinophagaceae bacterium]